jgi:Flp pilus assembly protein CpaB
VAAGRLLSPGETISDSDLVEVRLNYPSGTPADAAAWSNIVADIVKPNNRGATIGRTVAKEIKMGVPLMESSLAPINREANLPDWKIKIPEGTRAVAIPIAGAGAVNGLVEVGDKVDVLVTIDVPNDDSGAQQQNMTIPMRMGDQVQNVTVPTGARDKGDPMTFFLLQNVEVLSVGAQTYREDELADDDPLAAMAAKARGGGGGITVALPPDKVLLLTFALSGGDATFALALRTPNDESLYDTLNNPPAEYKQLLMTVGATR